MSTNENKESKESRDQEIKSLFELLGELAGIIGLTLFFGVWLVWGLGEAFLAIAGYSFLSLMTVAYFAYIHGYIPPSGSQKKAKTKEREKDKSND